MTCKKCDTSSQVGFTYCSRTVGGLWACTVRSNGSLHRLNLESHIGGKLRIITETKSEKSRLHFDGGGSSYKQEFLLSAFATINNKVTASAQGRAPQETVTTLFKGWHVSAFQESPPERTEDFSRKLSIQVVPKP